MQQAKNIDIYSLKDSPKWLGLSMQSKVLISLLQIDWRIDRPVPYSVSEAMNKIPCAKGTAQRAFKELEEAGFIVSCGFKMDEVKKIKSRHWMLTWLPYQNDGPTNNWDQKAVEHDGSELKNNLPIDGLRDIDYRSLLYKYIKLKIAQTEGTLLFKYNSPKDFENNPDVEPFVGYWSDGETERILSLEESAFRMLTKITR
tara:strand:+ start:6400 stop:6999 length:600 start_codon:yes stop_codon:yes gene_type:complete